MPRPSPLPSSLRLDGFTVAEGRALGVTRRRMRAGDLETPFHGVRVRRGPMDARARAAAYAPKLRESEVLSHASALAVFGVWTPSRCTAAVHVMTFGPSERARGAGVRGHESEPGRVRRAHVGDIPIVHPADAWCQLGEHLSVRELVLVGDALVRRRNPILTISDLHEAVQRWSGRRGVQNLRGAVRLVRERTDSYAETELRMDALEAGLPEPEVNGAILDENGRIVALGDLVFRRYKTALEFDGEQHRADNAQFARDVTRLDDVARLGWRLIRVTKADRGVARAAKLARVREALIDRGWRP
ncbi:hypothetical protein [Microbacterium aoyamense]|nr:hypothetical protein [Microbacterium aoyamense]